MEISQKATLAFGHVSGQIFADYQWRSRPKTAFSKIRKQNHGTDGYDLRSRISQRVALLYKPLLIKGATAPRQADANLLRY